MIAVTTDQKLARHLALVWGITPVYTQDAVDIQNQESLSTILHTTGITDEDLQVIAIA